MATGRNPVPFNGRGRTGFSSGNRGRSPVGSRRAPRDRPGQPYAPVMVRRRVRVQPTRFRLILVWGVLLLGMVALLLNLFRLQVLDADFLNGKAAEQQLVNLRPFVPRRSVVDRAGNVVAIDRPVFTLYAHPILFDQPPQDVATVLSPVIEKKSADLIQKFQQGDTGIEIEYSLSEDVARKVRHLNLNGLELVSHQQRFYPQRELFANVVGYVDVDQQGQAGIEQTHQEQLKRPEQEMEVSKTGDGIVLPDRIEPNRIQSDDVRLQLSLDSRLQRIARTTLKQKLAEYNAKRGVVLIMDVQDGGLRTLVTEPSYDPNRYSESDFKLFRNWALSDLYEPGSTFKPINVAIALETGSVKPDDVFYDQGEIIVSGWPIRNFDYNERGGRGNQSITDIITHSSNVGMVHIMEQVEPNLYYNWLEKLKLDQLTDVDLPGETAGQLKDRQQFVEARVEPATTAFGQGFSLTPIKLAQLHSALANGGRLVTPHVATGLVNANGDLVEPIQLPAPRPIFSPDTTRTVIKMMESVVENGTATIVRIPGYHVAGKTGTAQKASPTGGYMDRARITSFVSIFPSDAPRYVVLVVVDEPQGDDAYGSTVAAPIAKTMLDALIAVDKIPPSNVSALTPAAQSDSNSASSSEATWSEPTEPASSNDEWIPDPAPDDSAAQEWPLDSGTR